MTRKHRHDVLIDRHTLFLSGLCVPLAMSAAFVAKGLTALIGLITNLSYYGRFSTVFSSPAGNSLGPWAVLVPVSGGIVVGIMARYGSKAIRGHGIPEAMEQILFNESRIPARITWLKPLSSAIAIGTGGPFGAEGPIIATGGALGSVLGQLLKITAFERKVLLAAGAASGMTAIFASPISAVLLAIELLLFEFRPRSFVPVAFAATVAMAARSLLMGTEAVFPMEAFTQPSVSALGAYVVEGAVIGMVSVLVTKLVYGIEDAFEHLPIHWMGWPALGGAAVGLIGLISPHTLGVGYDNIERILSGEFNGSVLFVFCFWKLLSWAIALGSGTSGGTLAPLFTIGGGVGAGLGLLSMVALPQAGIDPRVAALVGMAAMFAGASRALLASVLFTFEITRQPLGLVPLLGGCTASYVVSALFMKHTIMTEKIARRGRRVPTEYLADALDQVRVAEFASKDVVTLEGEDTVASVKARLISADTRYHHQGYPVVDQMGGLIGIVTRRDVLIEETGAGTKKVRELLHRPVISIDSDATLRQASHLMLRENVGRIVVVSLSEPSKILGILSRQDVLAAHRRFIQEHEHTERHLKLWR